MVVPLEPILEGMRGLSENSDPEYRSMRVQVHEQMECISKLLGLSRAEVGEICLDIFSCICVEDIYPEAEDFCICVEDIYPEAEDFDAVVTDIKGSVYSLVDDRLSARH